MNSSEYNNNNNSDNNNNNVSICYYHDEQFLPIQVTFRLHIDAPVLLIGIIGNVLNMLVFSSRFMWQNGVNKCLFLLSLSDLVIVICGAFMMSIPVLMDYLSAYWLAQLVAYSTRWLFPISQTAATYSVYLTVFVSTYQCIHVTHRRYAYKHLHSSVCNRCLVLITVFSLLFNLKRFMELKLEHCFSRRYNRLAVQPVPNWIMQVPYYFLVSEI